MDEIIEIVRLSKCLPAWFINEYKKLLALIDVNPHQNDAEATPAAAAIVSSTPTADGTFMDLFNTLAGMKSSTEAVSLTYHVMMGLGWTENMSDIEPLTDGNFSLQRDYPAIHDRITRLGLKDMKRAIDDIVLKISDNLHDHHNKRCCLALVGLLGMEQIDRNRTTLHEMFDLVVQKLVSYSESAALICQILKRLSWNSKEFEQYASPVYVMERDHPEIDLRLMVVSYYDNMEDDDYHNLSLMTSQCHLGGMNVSNKDKDEFVQLLCEKNVIKVGDVSKLDDRYGYFKQYNERYQVGLEVNCSFKLMNLPQRISYNKDDVIGEGSFGTIVYRGEYDGREVAVKRIHRNAFSISEKKLCHKNIIHYYCIEQDSACYYLAFELCLCTLKQYIEDKEEYHQTLHNISDFQIIKDILSGLKFLHENNIIHKDIRPSNILLTKHPYHSKAVISDFGISCFKLGERVGITTYGRKGTQGWIAPELYKKGTKLTLAIDIFSLGCLIYYVLTNGEHPFDYDEYNVTNSKYDLRLLSNIVEHVTAKPLIKQMIQYDPNERPNISDVYNHCLLWDVKQQMEFFQYASDWIDTLSSDDTIKKDLESNASKVFTRNWKDMINEDLRQDLEQGKYNGTSLNELLRAIRNKCHHYDDLPEPVKGRFKSCDELVSHFTSCFPSLLIVTYDFMKKHNMLQTQCNKKTIKSLQEALIDTKEELNKQMSEKDIHIAKMTRKVTEDRIVNTKDHDQQPLTSDVDAVEEIGQEPKRRKLDPDYILSEDQDKSKLFELLADISDKWDLIGIALGIEKHIINGLRQNENDNMVRLSDILDEWFDKDEDVTWKKIIDVVGGPIVRKRKTANKIRKHLDNKM